MTPPLHSIISRLHLKQLRLLVALGEHGSLLKASKQVALTQPGASKSLQEIETTFGAPLFVRHPRGVRCSPAGEALLPRIGPGQAVEVSGQARRGAEHRRHDVQDPRGSRRGCGTASNRHHCAARKRCELREKWCGAPI